jgi:ribosomal protein L11 methyltransferase
MEVLHMRWAEIAVETPRDSAEAVGAALLDIGSAGYRESGASPMVLGGFLPVTDALESALDRLRERLASLPEAGLPPTTGITLRYVEEADWANEWKKYFTPLEIGKRLLIAPSWEVVDPACDRVVVELDPGMAFGTGGHPTTRLCLAALEDYVTPGCMLADIGTGSGILAIAAARLGATTVLATDIDSLPRKIARENVERNGLGDTIRVLEMDEFDEAARDCDVIVANIIAQTIIEIAASVRPRLKPGGVFLASGIVEERLPEVLDAIEAAGFALIETREDEVWRFVAARNPHPPTPSP